MYRMLYLYVCLLRCKDACMVRSTVSTARFAVLVEGSGSNRHIVKSVDLNESNNIINIKRVAAGIGTADMATWHIMIEVKREDCINQVFEINVKSTDWSKDYA